MKFPIVTVTLVVAALGYVFWNQTQPDATQVESSDFANLAAKPVDRSAVVDLAISRISDLCEETTANAEDANAHEECVAQAESRTSSCRRAVYDRFPDKVRSDAVFRDITITTMNCLVRQTGIVQP
ncbi:MAG: hypothetical protein ABJM19_03715 [Marinobacter sp.]|uniref:hypothetical protein n=1 Tax=unclassified Marinobacter TaxID=83889 RepID=UPI00273B68DA|nr:MULTISPECIES: hypothetical protein [unclassified Marinobacter]MDP4547106.1 hypothetical protein [Marinobacter sp. MDS2]